MTERRYTLAAAWFAAAAGLVACGGAGPRTADVGAPRPYVGDPFPVGAGASERFGFGAAPTAGGPTSGAAQPGVAPAADAFEFDLPAGWEALPPTSMRAVNLRVADEPRAQATLTLLAGDGGGLAANVDRWRGQMGLAPSGDPGLVALERTTLLGREAVRVDLSGDFSGMGSESLADARMLGLLAVAPEGSAFLKFTGPASVVERERAAFDRLAASLRVGGTGARPEASAGPAAEPPGDGGRLTYAVPDGWTRGPERMLREATFLVGSDGATECSVSILAGDGGGIRSNFDRWRGQMGRPPLTADELAALERADCLGGTALLIEVAGDYEGMGGERVTDALMLGAVASLRGDTVFVKLVGPRATAAAERERFRAFVEALRAADDASEVGR